MLDLKEDLLDEDTGLPIKLEEQVKPDSFGMQPHNRTGDLYIEVDLPVTEDIFEPEPEPEVRGKSMSLEARTAAQLETCNLGFIKGTVVTKQIGRAHV